MYPRRELTRLAAQKKSLQADIAERRVQCAEALASVATPLEWLDRVATFWRDYSPLVKITAVPLGLLVKRALFPRFKVLGALVRWGPLALSAVRGLRSILGVSRT